MSHVLKQMQYRFAVIHEIAGDRDKKNVERNSHIFSKYEIYSSLKTSINNSVKSILRPVIYVSGNGILP